MKATTRTLRSVGWTVPVGALVGYLCANDHPHALMSPLIEIVLGGVSGAVAGLVLGWFMARRERTPSQDQDPKPDQDQDQDQV